jgi:uncharacterized SAM-binding protein YcdF (DUF218 family)
VGNEGKETGEHLARYLRSFGRLILYLLASLGLLWLVPTLTPLDHWWATKLAGPWNAPKGDVLIVLGGSMVDHNIGGSSYWRAIHAVTAYHRGGFREVLLSGRRTAPAMAKFLESQGVPRAAIVLEEQATSTRQHALYTKELLARMPGRKVLLTSDYHMFRAHWAFQKEGLDVVPSPFPDVRKRSTTWRGRWPAFLDLVQESMKIGYYYVQGWI